MADPRQSESIRRQCLLSCSILDTPREREYDRLVFMFAQITRAPIAAFILIDDERCWSKSVVGQVHPSRSRAESLCDKAVRVGSTVIVPDTVEDQRFAPYTQLPTGQLVRSILSAPVRGPMGAFVGTLCAYDVDPHQFTAKQANLAEQLANEARELLGLRVPGVDVTRLRDR